MTRTTAALLSIALCLVALAAPARAQTQQLVVIPNNGTTPVMSVDANGAQQMLAPSVSLEMNQVPLDTLAVRFQFLEHDAPIYWLKNQTDHELTISPMFGASATFAFRPWQHLADWSGQQGYWSADAVWTLGSDVAPNQIKHELHGSGAAALYPAQPITLAANGSPNDADEHYGYPPLCDIPVSFFVTSPFDLTVMKRGHAVSPNEPPKVSIELTPRGVVVLDTATHGSDHEIDYHSVAWTCSHAVHFGPVTITAYPFVPQ